MVLRLSLSRETSMVESTKKTYRKRVSIMNGAKQRFGDHPFWSKVKRQ